MDYKKRITAAKVATPVVVMIAGAQAVKWIGTHIGFDVGDETSNQIIAGIYGLCVGLANWVKNRKLGSYKK